jgi:hypothetical protein
VRHRLCTVCSTAAETHSRFGFLEGATDAEAAWRATSSSPRLMRIIPVCAAACCAHTAAELPSWRPTINSVFRPAEKNLAVDLMQFGGR